MQNIDIRKLSELGENLERAMKEFPADRRAAHEELGKILKQRLDASISARVNDAHGKIRGWQEVHVGSRGGYVAIRPAKNPSGKDGAAAVTGYLESGHRIRLPSGKAKRLQKSRIRVAYIRGRYFYRDTAREIERDAQQIMENLAQTVAKKIEGR